jgi:hypothetical protein
MPAVTLNTRTDLNTSKAKLGTFELTTTTTVEGWSIKATAEPVMPELSKSGLSDISAEIPAMNAEASKDGITVFFDNLQLIPKKQFVPRVKIAKSVDVADQTYDVKAELIPKGNTSAAKDNSPSDAHVVKLGVTAPAISGFTPKLDFSTANNTATVEVSGKVDKATVTLKADIDVEGKKSKGASAKVAYPLPEGVKATVEVKDNKSAKIELAKDQSGATFTLEVPVADVTAPSLSADDLTLKVKYSMDFDM